MKRFMDAFVSVLAMCAAFGCGSLFAETSYIGANNGDWNVPENWSGNAVPGESDDVVIDGKLTVNLETSVKVASLTLSNSSTLHVTAQPLNEVMVFDPTAYVTEQARRDAVAAALWANRTVVEVTGNFVVNAGCTVKPENDKITGTSVVFKVGTATIDGTMNATGLGWGWAFLDEGETKPEGPAGALVQRGGDNSIVNNWLYTYAFGSGYHERGTYTFSPLHGGTRAADKTFVYGYPCAPFLPGSPSEYYTTARDMRGGGSIVIYAATSISVTGSLETKGKRDGSTGTQSAGCTGGSVWLAAPDIVLSESAQISADGETPSHGAYGRGGGGRIAMTQVTSEDEVATLAAGDIPPSMVVSDYDNPNVTVTSGNADLVGTVKWAMSGYLQTTLTTSSNVDGLLAAGVTWGDEVLINGEYERTAPQYAFLADNPLIRYTCKGYVLSGKNGEVSSSDEARTVSFAIDGAQGPYTLTWKWGDRTEVDPDPVSRHWVGGSSTSLMDPSNWEPAGVPTRVDELYLTNALAVATKVNVAKLVLSGGLLMVGSSSTRPEIEFAVTGDVTVCDGATLAIHAPLKTDPAGYTSIAAARELLWQNRTKVTVGGTLTVENGSTVQVSNHPETGDLLVFEVGAFDLAAGGTVTAAGGGFTWVSSVDKVLPEGTIRLATTGKINNVGSTPCHTYGFGSALDWQGQGYIAAGGHGNSGQRPYGLDFAPFEPGSPGTIGANYTSSAGGGSIVVLAKGAVTLAGTLNADGVLGAGVCGSSGGSIWIVGDTIAYGEGLVATARGVAASHWAYGAGDGGRIAFMTDVTTDAQVETMVNGTKLEGFIYAALSQQGVSVDGGRRTPADETPAGNSGTAVSAFSMASYELVTVTAAPLEAISAKANYGEYQYRGGEAVVLEADALGTDPSDPQNVRYVCTGYVVSNATEQVAAGETADLSFPVVKGAGPYKVTWLWNVRETRSRVNVFGPGAVSLNGQAVNELWVADTEDVTFAAAAEQGKNFWTWSGADVPAASVAEASFTIPANKPHVVSAVFVDSSAAAKTCTMKATASGNFYDAENWEDALVPNPQDDVIISGGAVSALGRFACGSLTMTGGLLPVSQMEEVRIAGDVTLSGSSVLTVTAVPTDGSETAFADGATRVAIGGNLVVTDKATVKPVSDPWTGGSVVFSVAGDFTLGASAKFDAVGAGWNWVEYTGEPSPLARATAASKGKNYQTMAPGAGSRYTVGGSYGGRGGYSSGWSYAVKDVYGFANAPIHPGSPNGVESDFMAGGGLIRIHVSGKASVDGVLDSSAGDSFYGGPSGGGIWLTAGKFAFGATARLLAKGGPSGYSSQGAGGRIAICTGLMAAQLASLQTTGKCARRAKDIELFGQDFPGVTVDVSLGAVKREGWGPSGDAGTFSYYPAPNGLMLLIY